ncbi:hypothetical protein [Laceyella putida]|uniref:Tox-SHH domain-containing protein n=1 Tax=Laceyella putida TaxID=110101 RepID=A0ABW2RPU2_9BACL
MKSNEGISKEKLQTTSEYPFLVKDQRLGCGEESEPGRHGSVTARVDWNNISAKEIHDLSEEMFDAAKVSKEVRNNYYQKFHQYIYSLD